MAQDPINPVNPLKGVSITGQKFLDQAQAARAPGALVVKEQVDSEQSMMNIAETGDFDLLAMGKNFKDLYKQTRREVQTTTEVAEEVAEDGDAAQGVAQQFNKKNPELNTRSLIALRASVYSDDNPDEITAKIRSTYPDPSLADEALDFLLATSGKNPALKGKLETAKQQFNETHGREIRAGKNIQEAARDFSAKGLGNPTALRDLYRDITGNPREAPALFDELANNFPFPKMKVVIDFVLHSLGQDMKSKGPSITRPELQRLFSEARTMQAILGVYRFFHSRMGLVQAEFKRADLTMPSTINFQNLSKAFMNVLKERYPSVQRILAFATMLGISEETLAKIIAFNQLRDALRNVSPKLFKSEQHRQDILMTFIETLSDLEDELDKDDEEEEEE